MGLSVAFHKWIGCRRGYEGAALVYVEPYGCNEGLVDHIEGSAAYQWGSVGLWPPPLLSSDPPLWGHGGQLECR